MKKIINKLNEGEIEEIYQRIVSPHFKELNKERRKLQQWLVAIVFFTASIFLMGGMYYFHKDVSQFIIYSIFTFVLTPIIIFLVKLIFYDPKKFRFRNIFKEKIVNQLVNDLYENITYTPNKGINHKVFNDCQIFPLRPNRYKTEDHFSGTKQGIPFEFAEIRAEHKGNNSSPTLIFCGTFFTAKFNKKLSAKTIVYPDLAEKAFGRVLGTGLQKFFTGLSNKISELNPLKLANQKNIHLIKLENTEFEKEFAVYSEDQIEARKILTPVIMENLVKLQRSTKFRIYASFLDNRVYFAINTNKDMFEPGIFSQLISKKDILLWSQTLDLFLNIVTELDLANDIFVPINKGA